MESDQGRLLPSTPDELSPSAIRRHPPTPEELRDVLALIGVAKGRGTDRRGSDGSPASAQPLAGRRVMIPVTTKAFFEGTLSPPADDLDAGGDDAASERIFVNDGGGNLVEMTRSSAEDLFADMRDRRDDGAAKLSRKNFPTKSIEMTREDLTLCDNDASQHTIAEPLPLMEIRETCDDSGSIIDSEVVNMSNTMKRLEEKLKNVNVVGEGDGDGRKLGELLARTLKEGEANISKGARVAEGNAGHLESERRKAPKESTAKDPISDASYEAIRNRLEELERLEEEDAKSKKENARSSKRLQSNGWSKGFLNNTKKKNERTRRRGGAEKKEIKAKNANVDSSNDAAASKPGPDLPSNAELGVHSSSNVTGISKSEPANLPVKASRVSFSGDDDIKEIPRIGQSKIPSRPSSSRRPVSFEPTTLEDLGGDPSPPAPTAPFEENIFQGVVKERGKLAQLEPKKPVRQEDGGSGGKKKLSRFAQRRLQRE